MITYHNIAEQFSPSAECIENAISQGDRTIAIFTGAFIVYVIVFGVILFLVPWKDRQ